MYVVWHNFFYLGPYHTKKNLEFCKSRVLRNSIIFSPYEEKSRDLQNSRFEELEICSTTSPAFKTRLASLVKLDIITFSSQMNPLKSIFHNNKYKVYKSKRRKRIRMLKFFVLCKILRRKHRIVGSYQRRTIAFLGTRCF